MKDASSTDVVVHRGRVLSTHYQCGDAYAFDADTMESLGPEPWVPQDTGISAHPKVCARTGELHYFRYGKAAPYLHYGVVDARGERVHDVAIPLPGPRLPHDMAMSERFVVFNDFPIFWDPALLARGIHRPRWDPAMPSRFAVLPRRAGPTRCGGSRPPRPTSSTSPTPSRTATSSCSTATPSATRCRARSSTARRVRLAHAPGRPRQPAAVLAPLADEPATGACREEDLSPTLTEFPTIDPRVAGVRNRHCGR
ncbi:carotenoid oxygenase family protein [Nannocystis pusilla]|uniref:Carotenoid oxygenase family protein n=1 Tax=Nannocystis pusilla TaxID=889268 RepID=A0A9X3F8S3_9BACT|nr:carotenoid oxygenase family protein [Nannocystis pusilla]MCY1013863.1 carotenoid oxygenase family protein [Nannocystis pusilla]